MGVDIFFSLGQVKTLLAERSSIMRL